MSYVGEMCHGSRYGYGLMTRLYQTFFVLDITDMNETLWLCVDNFHTVKNVYMWKMFIFVWIFCHVKNV
jgi:hypothetical protein